MATVYKVEEATLIFAIEIAIYYIPATELEPGTKIKRTEEDRILPTREIPYPIDLTFEVIEIAERQ